MLDYKLITNKIRVIRKCRKKGLSMLVAEPSLVVNATTSTDQLKTHLREHFVRVSERPEEEIKAFLGRVFHCMVLKDECVGRGRYYPDFLMAREPRGVMTTIHNLLSNEIYIYKREGSKFIMDDSPPPRMDNQGWVLDYSTRIESKNNNTKFVGEVEKAKTTKPILALKNIPFPTIDRTFYMGVELEVVRHKNAKIDVCLNVIKDLNKDFDVNLKNYSFAILKFDGSVPGGFEIVSAPATLKAHHKMWDKFFNNSAKDLRSFSNPNTGMHVHVSRATFTDSGDIVHGKRPQGHLGRLINFYNKASNRGFIERMAGRNQSSYSNFHPKKVTAVFTGASIGERYQAINLIPTNTIEVRIFKGNVKKEGFMKNIEFVHASVEFTRQAGYGITGKINTKAMPDKNPKNTTGVEDCRHLDHKEFIKWMLKPENIATYPYLSRWLQSRELIQSKFIKLQEEKNPKDTRVNPSLLSNFLNDVA